MYYLIYKTDKIYKIELENFKHNFKTDKDFSKLHKKLILIMDNMNLSDDAFNHFGLHDVTQNKHISFMGNNTYTDMIR